jgi:nucleotide-binding universal stress UspA family protein
MKHILVAFDGSEPAGRAFEFALSLADKFGSAIHVLAVARPPEPPEEVETEAAIESAREHCQQQFAVLQARAANAAVKASFVVLVGHRRSRSCITPRRMRSTTLSWATAAKPSFAVGC